MNTQKSFENFTLTSFTLILKDSISVCDQNFPLMNYHQPSLHTGLDYVLYSTTSHQQQSVEEEAPSQESSLEELCIRTGISLQAP